MPKFIELTDKELAFYKAWAEHAFSFIVNGGYYFSRDDDYRKAQELIAQWGLQHKQQEVFAIEAGKNYSFDSAIEHKQWREQVRKDYENILVTTTITGDWYRVHVHTATRKNVGVE